MITSPNDTKQYLSFTLDNGLRVIAIEDADSEKAAAALTVNCGHFDDPLDRQGMAHFLEHMLFLGTKSHPEPGEFHQFIASHGGNHNAWTGSEFTSFFFDVKPKYLKPALTRFSQFFSEPLLNPAYVEKERNAVDAEYKLKLKEDSHRIYQVHKETINQAHPFSKFSVGNIDTLADRDGQSIRDELVKFHETYYVASHMTLVVYAKESLDEQRALIEQLFGSLEKRQGPPRDIQVPMYQTEHEQLDIFIKPHKHTQRLIASFAMPCEDRFYRCKTIQFIAHLIGYEGKGSLLSALKQQGWANALTAGRGISGSNFKDFNVSIDLTGEGLAHCDEIVNSLFDYIRLMAEKAPLAALYDDKRKLLKTAFDYQEKSKPISLVGHLSLNMFHYQPQDYIYGDYIMTGLDMDEYQRVCDMLTPENLRLTHIHPDVVTDRRAKWYNTPYRFTPISSERTEQWHKPSHLADQLILPSPNPYLKDPVVMEPWEDNDHPNPYKISEQPGYSFWFKQDNQFGVPKGHCYVALDCPVSTASVKHIAITRMFTELFLDTVIEDHYDAELAGLSYHIYVHQGRIDHSHLGDQHQSTTVGRNNCYMPCRTANSARSASMN